MKYRSTLSLLAVLFVEPLHVNIALASDTSSTISGSVQSGSGIELSDHTVKIIHIPSGTSKKLTTNQAGEYRARGLHVGGA